MKELKHPPETALASNYNTGSEDGCFRKMKKKSKIGKSVAKFSSYYKF